ncbi:MAG: phosphatidylserine decarboxylase [Gemmataceae bacterium]
MFVRVERQWGRLRRWFMRKFRPGHVNLWKGRRRGHCERFTEDVIDPRDLKFIRSVCGYDFDPALDVYRRRETLGFARYGYAELVGFSVLFGLGSTLGSILAVLVHPAFFLISTICVVFWVEVIWFFRDPERIVPSDPRSVVSPADGTITHVETVNEPGIGSKCLRISIFLSVFNVHGNRIPRDSRVEEVSYFRGRYLDARHPNCAAQNEQLWLDLVDAQSQVRFRVKQISGAIARRIVCWLRLGEVVKAGDRYGMIKFGSRTDLIVPSEHISETLVKVGDKVRGGVTVLAKWQ